jgi:hydrogenase expression/formation protein HypE
MVCPQDKAELLAETLKGCKYTEGTAVIGQITDQMPGRVTMTTEIGAQTLLPQPGNELLPRIC